MQHVQGRELPRMRLEGSRMAFGLPRRTMHELCHTKPLINHNDAFCSASFVRLLNSFTPDTLLESRASIEHGKSQSQKVRRARVRDHSVLWRGGDMRRHALSNSWRPIGNGERELEKMQGDGVWNPAGVGLPGSSILVGGVSSTRARKLEWPCPAVCGTAKPTPRPGR